MATFGFTSEGATTFTCHANEMFGSVFTAPENGTATSISVWCDHRTGYTPKIKCALYRNSDRVLIGYTEEWTITSGYDNFHEFAITSGGTLVSGVDYVPVWWISAEKMDGRYTAESNKGKYDAGDAYNGFPNPHDAWQLTVNDRFSIYVTYTPASSGIQPYTLINELGY